MNNTIKTTSGYSEFKFKEKGSQFIAKSYPVENETEANDILANLKKEFYDATHHCYAFNFGENDFRYSDDGEPSGTAGIRILNAIQHFDLVNIFICVIRFYGGTKLGVGPLGKSYYEAAFGALENSNMVEKELYQKVVIYYNYENTSPVHHFLSYYSAIEMENKFADQPSIECLLKPEKIPLLENDLKNSTAGSVKTVALDEYKYLKVES